MSRDEDWFFDGLSDELRSILTDQTAPIPSLACGTGVSDAHRGSDPAANHRERGIGSRAHGASDGPGRGRTERRLAVPAPGSSGKPHSGDGPAVRLPALITRALARSVLYTTGFALFVAGLILLAGCKPPAPHCPAPLVAVWHDNPRSGSPGRLVAVRPAQMKNGRVRQPTDPAPTNPQRGTQ